MSRFLRPLPANGRVKKRYAVYVNDKRIGEVLCVHVRPRRNMIGSATPWVVKVAGAGRPIWAQWFNSEKEAAEWLVDLVNERAAARRERVQHER